MGILNTIRNKTVDAKEYVAAKFDKLYVYVLEDTGSSDPARFMVIESNISFGDDRLTIGDWMKYNKVNTKEVKCYIREVAMAVAKSSIEQHKKDGRLHRHEYAFLTYDVKEKLAEAGTHDQIAEKLDLVNMTGINKQVEDFFNNLNEEQQKKLILQFEKKLSQNQEWFQELVQDLTSDPYQQADESKVAKPATKKAAKTATKKSA